MASASMIVAGIQMNVAIGDVESNLSQLAYRLDDPRAAAAGLVVFPECGTTGYCFDSKEEALRYAEPIPGPTTDRLQQLAARKRQFLAGGVLERNGEHIHNSCVLVGPEGLVGKYRKIHLPYLGVDRYATAGEEPPSVYDIGGMRVGMHICYDGSFPELPRIMALQGADLLILPTNWPPGSEQTAAHLPNARAIENHVYYMVVNRVGQERGFRFIGQSSFCAPGGARVATASETDEDIVLGTVQPHLARNKRLVRSPGKHIIDRFADRRPAVYSKICQPHTLVRDQSNRP